MNIAQHLAATLKTLRQQRGWSLSRLAEETGVSKAMLGQIERNESSPTVATLWKIATGLNVPFSAFIVPDASAAPSAFDPQQQAMVVTPVFPWDPELRFDRAHFKALGTNSLDYEVVYIVEDPTYNLYMDLQQSINLGLLREFKAMGVEFAFPTRTVHIASTPPQAPAVAAT